MNEAIAKEIMAKSAAGYDKIAAQFSQTRNYFWPELAFVKNYIKNGDNILDIGCGNGRFLGFLLNKNPKVLSPSSSLNQLEQFQHLEQLEHFSYTGIDNSKELVKIAQEIYSDTLLDNRCLEPVFNNDCQRTFLVADALNLPFENENFDIVVSFAVLHHIPSQALREKFISEAARVLKKDGYCFVYVPFLYYYHAEKGYYGDYWRYTEDSLRYLFKPFRTIEIHNVRGAFETLVRLSPLGRWSVCADLAYLIDYISGKRASKQTSGYFVFLQK